jgi:hypothetical protein
MKRGTFFILIGILALLTKLIIEFRTSLIPGIGGGYNPVQIRAILETGRLVINDMPFVFYLNALSVKLYSSKRICRENIVY